MESPYFIALGLLGGVFRSIGDGVLDETESSSELGSKSSATEGVIDMSSMLERDLTSSSLSTSLISNLDSFLDGLTELSLKTRNTGLKSN